MKREEIIKALEHVTEKTKVKKLIKRDRVYNCPLCNTVYTESFICERFIKYCLICGQRIEV